MVGEFGMIGTCEFWTFRHEGVLGLSPMYGYISPVLDKTVYSTIYIYVHISYVDLTQVQNQF